MENIETKHSKQELIRFYVEVLCLNIKEISEFAQKKLLSLVDNEKKYKEYVLNRIVDGFKKNYPSLAIKTLKLLEEDMESLIIKFMRHPNYSLKDLLYLIGNEEFIINQEFVLDNKALILEHFSDFLNKNFKKSDTIKDFICRHMSMNRGEREYRATGTLFLEIISNHHVYHVNLIEIFKKIDKIIREILYHRNKFLDVTPFFMYYFILLSLIEYDINKENTLSLIPSFIYVKDKIRLFYHEISGLFNRTMNNEFLLNIHIKEFIKHSGKIFRNFSNNKSLKDLLENIQGKKLSESDLEEIKNLMFNY